MNDKSKTNRIVAVVITGVLLTFPLRDAFGFTISGIPFRLAEIWLGLSALALLMCSKWRYDKASIGLIGILALNFINTIIGIGYSGGKIVSSFAFKYLARNLLYLFALAVILGVRYEVKEQQIDQLMKFMVWVQLCASIYTVLTDKFLKFGQLVSTHDNEPANYINISGHLIDRLKGTCSEPGYLAPLIALPLYYFIVKYCAKDSNQNKQIQALFYIAILAFISLFSFSSAVYLFDLIVVLLALAKIKQSIRKYILIFLGLVLFIGVVVLVAANETARKFVCSNFIDKINYYVFRNDSIDFNYSAVDRAQHVDLAKQLIRKSTIFELLFGRGTGSYYFNSLREDSFLQSNVSEANSIYLSSLVDRGIIGFACVITTFILCYKRWIRSDIYSSTLFIGIIMQGGHWFITGNYWLYYFWAEVILLIGYYKYKTSNKVCLQ